MLVGVALFFCKGRDVLRGPAPQKQVDLEPVALLRPIYEAFPSYSIVGGDLAVLRRELGPALAQVLPSFGEALPGFTKF